MFINFTDGASEIYKICIFATHNNNIHLEKTKCKNISRSNFNEYF